MVTHHKELRVYQEAFSLASRIFELTQSWPAEERFSLVDQVRRSSRSVCANIAEAWRKRRYPRHFVSKLTDADAEAAETQVWLEFAVVCGYLNGKVAQELDTRYEQVMRSLVTMMKQSTRWTGPSKGTVGEPRVEYLIS